MDRITLTKISPNEWYEKLILLGGGIMLFSIIFGFEFITDVIFFAGMGLMMIGFGELINHKQEVFINYTSEWVPFKVKIRKNEEVGLLLVIVGISAVIVSVFSVFNVFF